MSDRALQDDIIRALSDAPYRASSEWRARRLVDPDRFERYARFVARHFYHERIVHFFKYSGALARVTGRRPEAVLHRAGFEALLPAMVVASRDTARAVAGLVVSHVAGGTRDAVPYLGDLLRYEAAMMVVEAGPRVWRDGARGSGLGDRRAPVTVEGTEVLNLTFDLPVVLPALLQAWSVVPDAPRRPTKLLVARSPHGRVAVVRASETVAAVLAEADGTRPLAAVAERAGLTPAELAEALEGLAEIGAVRFATGS